MIERLKNNTTPFGLLDDEMKEAFKEFTNTMDKVEVYDGTGWEKAFPSWYQSIVYRLSPDYEEPRNTGRWVEYPIYVEDEQYMCDVTHLDDDYLTTDLPSVVGFGGIMFEGKQKWYNATAYLDAWDDEKPAKPIKARFWVVK